jgi:hypothetical protein
MENQKRIDKLKSWLPEGSTVYTVLRSVTRSGMNREISVHCVSEDHILWLSGMVGEVIGLKRGKKEGLKIGGCGMDMGFEIAYRLSEALYGNGYALKHSWV